MNTAKNLMNLSRDTTFGCNKSDSAIATSLVYNFITTKLKVIQINSFFQQKKIKTGRAKNLDTIVASIHFTRSSISLYPNYEGIKLES